ncbi:MAG: spondin domain-containing protein [Gaiellaceae bacterium MAG52_C11]|nr:spondin domain-containing protein [Candidatus Gaiellasilicea maunaloa]
MRKLILLGLIALAATALAVGSASADDDEHEDDGTKTWRVTISNLTPAGPGAPGSQPLSPPLFVVHSRQANVWSVGQIASHGVAAIAEDANNAPLESALPAVQGVKTVFTGAGGPIPSGATRSFTVETSGRFNRLSVVSMLVNTNDAFTGLDSLRLRGHGSAHETMAYDAGSERNNELKSHIPGPCCGNPFVRDPEGAVIAPHEGITGGGELNQALYDWNGAVARITIERVS